MTLKGAVLAAVLAAWFWVATPAPVHAQNAGVSSPGAPAPAHKRHRASGAKLPAGEQFATAASAQASCPGDAVVWANMTSRVYHKAGSKYFGKTKHGVFACTKVLAAAGFRASKS
jgi:hypothetical protein